MVEGAKRTRTVHRELGFKASGEIIPVQWEEPVKPRGRTNNQNRKKRLTVNYHDTVDELANMDLTGNDRRVLLILTSMMGFNEPFRYSTNEIARRLGMAPSNVSKIIRRLKDRNLLIEVAPLKNYLHPKFYWMGDPDERPAVLEMVENIIKNRTAAP